MAFFSLIKAKNHIKIGRSVGATVPRTEKQIQQKIHIYLKIITNRYYFQSFAVFFANKPHFISYFLSFLLIWSKVKTRKYYAFKKKKQIQ